MKYIKLFESFVNSKGELDGFDFGSDLFVGAEGELKKDTHTNYTADENGIIFTVYDIEWEDDGDDISDLPETIEISVPLDVLEDGLDIGEYLGDKITEETGFTHYSFKIQRPK